VLFREEAGNYPNDVLYAFGLLYARGLRPELRFRWQENRRELGREQAEEELGRFFERYTPLTPAVRRRIGRYVRERTRGGRFRQSAPQCQGFLLWEVEPGLSAPGARERTRAALRPRSRRLADGRHPGSAS